MPRLPDGVEGFAKLFGTNPDSLRPNGRRPKHTVEIVLVTSTGDAEDYLLCYWCGETFLVLGEGELSGLDSIKRHALKAHRGTIEPFASEPHSLQDGTIDRLIERHRAIRMEAVEHLVCDSAHPEYIQTPKSHKTELA